MSLGIQAKSKVIISLASFILLLRLITPPEALAHCPLCVGGAAVGLSVARFFGIDDSITGVWMAAFLGAVSFWFDSYLIKKFGDRLKLTVKKIIRPVVYITFFILTIWSFYAFNDYVISKFQFFLINKHAGNIFGIDKLSFGLISGGLLFYLIDVIDNELIKKNGKVLFPYQRIIVSLGGMILLSICLFILINYFI